MKARDLAALAALGIAGKYAYDKFGRKKDDEPKSKGKLGEAQSANDGDAGESEARMSKRDMNEGSGRRDAGGNTEDVDRRAGVPERDYSNEGRNKVKKEIEYPLFPRKKDKETFVRPTAAGGNSKTPKVVTRPDGDDRFVSPEVGAQANKPRRYNPAADSNTASSTAAGMATNVPRRPAVASSTAAGMAAYVPRNAAAVEQARLDALRASGGRRAKGGVVKMASGGMTSSKMSKPSGASRGDGIAQRGRTRGTLR